MTFPTAPKALLFDIGGVCVISPLGAILSYETNNNIPLGWINFSISRLAPNGAFQRLERGETELGAGFFEEFSRDLHVREIWEEFLNKKKQQQGQKSGGDEGKHEDINGALRRIPRIDAEALFWSMMHVSQTLDPDIYPALKTLKASDRFVIAALSNTVIFPPGHPYATAATELYAQFDVFISSARVGMRKPERSIYELALREMDAWARGKGRGGITAGDVLFLDDIGENLKGARGVGMRTLKVGLGRGAEAVLELERITGMGLRVDGKARL